MNKKTRMVTGLAALTLVAWTLLYNLKAGATPPLQVPAARPMAAPVSASIPERSADPAETAPAIPHYDSIKDRMLNAIDNYQTIKGTYHSVLKPLGEDQIVDFEVSENGSFHSYVKTTDQRTSEISETKFDGQTILFLYHQDKSFKRSPVAPGGLSKPEGPRVYKDETGMFNYVYRGDPACADGNDVSFPQKYAFWLDDETNNYSVTGEEQILDRDAVVISGTLEPIMAQKHQATNFQMWVDAETGVLLKLIETDDNHAVTNRLDVLSLTYNQELDGSKAKTDAPPGWKALN